MSRHLMNWGQEMPRRTLLLSLTSNSDVSSSEDLGVPGIQFPTFIGLPWELQVSFEGICPSHLRAVRVTGSPSGGRCGAYADQG